MLTVAVTRRTDCTARPPSPGVSGGSNVLASGALGALSLLEGDGLVFAEVVETRLGAGRVMEEVFVAVRGQDKTEAFVADESLDCAGHRRHVSSLLKAVS